jgi:hypothetical protein
VIAGLITLVAFLLTGVYMKTHSVKLLPDGVRLLYRSRHIYLLFSGLLNLVVGLRYPNFAVGTARVTSTFASALVLVAPLFICAGFFLEPPSGNLETPWSRVGVYAAALGTVLLAIAQRKNRNA